MSIAGKARKGNKGDRLSTPAERLGYQIPDPAGWYPVMCKWYRDTTAEWAEGPSDIFIFLAGNMGRIVLQDAISVVGLAGAINIDASEWVTEDGYPEFFFHAARLAEVVGVLERARYSVKILSRVTVHPRRRRDGSRRPARQEGWWSILVKRGGDRGDERGP